MHERFTGADEVCVRACGHRARARVLPNISLDARAIPERTHGRARRTKTQTLARARSLPPKGWDHWLDHHFGFTISSRPLDQYVTKLRNANVSYCARTGGMSSFSASCTPIRHNFAVQ